MPIVRCPECDQRVEVAADEPEERVRCPACRVSFLHRRAALDAEVVAPDDAIRSDRPSRRRPRDADDDPADRPRRPVRKKKRGTLFLNGTTIGGLLGMVGTAAGVVLVGYATSNRGTDLPLVFLTAGILGIVGGAIGAVVGWIIDSIIHAVRASAPSDDDR